MDVLMSVHPKWCRAILCGEKTVEVRKRAPLLSPPYRVYLYCTKPNNKSHDDFFVISDKNATGNGFVVGEAACVGVRKVERPFGDKTDGTCLTARELYEYADVKDTLSYIILENPVAYERPVPISKFGLKRAPQSWQYVISQD